MEDKVSELTARDEAALAGLARWQATQAKWRRHDWCDANPATIDALMSGEMVAIEMDLLHDLRCGEGLGADVHARVAALLAATPARREG